MFTGMWTLIKLILRRDRVKLPVWILAIILSLISMVPLLRDVYGSTEELLTLNQTFGVNPAGLFLTGPMDMPTFGALFTIETVLWWGLAVAFMNTMFIVRHTRQNEEMGAQELLLSGRVHRATGLLSALAVAFAANLLLVMGIGSGLAAVHSDWGTADVWLYAVAMGLFGFVWAVLAAVAVQFVESARSANGLLAGLIGAAFLLRGIGDFVGKADANGLIQAAWPSSFSPFGWMQMTRSLTVPEWWPLIIPAVFSVIAVPIAFFLLSKRDVGAGILPARKGHARASMMLRTSLGLTWRLQKNVFIGWLLGVLAMVGTIGALVPEMSHVYESSEEMKSLITAMGGSGALVPAFLSAMLSIIILMVLAYAVHALGRLRSEESNGHLENLLATKLSRFKWIGLHTGVTLAGGTAMLAISGAILAVCVNLASDVTADAWEYTVAGLSYFPVLALFVGAYVLLFGIMPRIAGLVVWVYFGFVVFMSWLAPLLKLDEWVTDLSPMSHVAAAPAESIKSEPLLVMTAIALALLAAGVLSWRQRNLLER